MKIALGFFFLARLGLGRRVQTSLEQFENRKSRKQAHLGRPDLVGTSDPSDMLAGLFLAMNAAGAFNPTSEVLRAATGIGSENFDRFAAQNVPVIQMKEEDDDSATSFGAKMLWAERVARAELQDAKKAIEAAAEREAALEEKTAALAKDLEVAQKSAAAANFALKGATASSMVEKKEPAGDSEENLSQAEQFKEALYIKAKRASEAAAAALRKHAAALENKLKAAQRSADLAQLALRNAVGLATEQKENRTTSFQAAESAEARKAAEAAAAREAAWQEKIAVLTKDLEVAQRSADQACFALRTTADSAAVEKEKPAESIEAKLLLAERVKNAALEEAETTAQEAAEREAELEEKLAALADELEAAKRSAAVSNLNLKDKAFVAADGKEKPAVYIEAKLLLAERVKNAALQEAERTAEAAAEREAALEEKAAALAEELEAAKGSAAMANLNLKDKAAEAAQEEEKVVALEAKLRAAESALESILERGNEATEQSAAMVAELAQYIGRGLSKKLEAAQAALSAAKAPSSTSMKDAAPTAVEEKQKVETSYEAKLRAAESARNAALIEARRAQDEAGEIEIAFKKKVAALTNELKQAKNSAAKAKQRMHVAATGAKAEKKKVILMSTAIDNLNSKRSKRNKRKRHKVGASTSTK